MNNKKSIGIITLSIKNIGIFILLIFFLNICLIAIYQIYTLAGFNEKKINYEIISKTHGEYNWTNQYFDDELKIKAEYVPYIGYKERQLKTKNINIDSDGYRISRNNSKKPDVFFLGGSTMFGYGSNDSNTIPSIFSKLTNDSLTVRNLGNGSHTSTQNLIKIYDELLEYPNPKYIISYEVLMKHIIYF